jgi:hypothetical protein
MYAVASSGTRIIRKQALRRKDAAQKQAASPAARFSLLLLFTHSSRYYFRSGRSRAVRKSSRVLLNIVIYVSEQ